MACLVNQHGVANVGLTRGKIQYKRAIAPLVAEAFLPKPNSENFDTPIHLDGDKTNNHIDNLELRPRWFAVKYYRQFREPRRGVETPVAEVSTGEVFQDSWAAAVKYGLLDREILISILSRTYVWPTFQIFKIL